jgi:DNA helicase HerA-like ATPase
MTESTNGHSNGATPARSTPLGRVGAPKDAEATSEQFFFWAPDDRLVEKTQLVYVESPAGPQPAQFYGLVSEVFRRSRRADMLEESDRFDGRPEEEVPVESRGVTYAQVRVLASQTEAGHAVFTSPREESVVHPASEADVRVAYGFGDMEKSVAIGLVRNGGDQVIGPAYIDLDYLLGAQGGHMNVTGIAGVGTKSSFLMTVLSQVLRYCGGEAEERPENGERTQVRPVILNVKGFDLFWLDHWSKAFTEDDLASWRAMGWDEPRPLTVTFFAPQRPESDSLSVTVPGRSDVQPYSWSLEDILASGLFTYLFNDSDREDDNFALLVADIERMLSRERRQPDGTPVREMRRDTVAKTFQELFDWFERGLQRDSGEDKGDPFPADALFLRLESVHHPGTVRRFYRRLRRVVYESAGIFRLDGAGSHPLDITTVEPGKPVVIDIDTLPDRHLQRFVVAALLRQAIDDRTHVGLQGMHYLFVLDELNRFAPKGHSDPITQLIETVAAEMRSRGVILLGAQQQASLVSPRVVENSAVRVLGRTGGHELRHEVFSFLDESIRDYVEQLSGADKVVHQPSFREPMHVRVPSPPWAMRRGEATTEPPAFLREAATAATIGPKRLAPRAYEEIP